MRRAYNREQNPHTDSLMHRNIIQALHQWKNKAKRKPLIIRGARQVGKT